MTYFEPTVLLLVDSAKGTGPVEELLAHSGVPFATLDLLRAARAEAPVWFQAKNGAGCVVGFQDARDSRWTTTGRVLSVWAEDGQIGSDPVAHFQGANDDRAILRTLGLAESWLMAAHIRGFLAERFLFLPQVIERQRLTYPPYPLATARDVGFKIPPTVVGQVLSALYKRGPVEKMHYRPLAAVKFQVRDTQFVTVERWIQADRSFAMHQAFGPAVFSLRPDTGTRVLVLMLGGELFAIELSLVDPCLDAQITDVSFHAAKKNLKITVCSLAGRMRDLCQAFFRETGLQYGLIDLLHDPESGDLWYLATNGSPKLSLFQEAGLPVYERLIEWLRRGNEAS